MNTATEHIRVSEAKKRYLGGAMSVRWWYRQIEDGRLPHVRAGAAVLLRVVDVEAFVAGLFREKATPPEPPVESAPPPAAVSARSRAGGLRFFH